MIWLTWRQFRTLAAVMLAAVAALAAALAVTGPQLADLYLAAGSSLVDQLSSSDQSVYHAGLVVVLAVLAVIEMFWGAPLISRELETRHPLSWVEPGRHSHMLAGDQAGPRYGRRHDRRRTGLARGELVEQSHRPGCQRRWRD
ncbi:hypothetical protein [Streptomyces sp. NPDC057199]|uniref:hypothetical protein n=1 Tax=Streptomyces sp. NPDC057199 TaxID=3346047 RepID=UPI00363CD2AC